MSMEISKKEVKKHRNKKSAWVVIHNEVYDLTKFLDEHPGGADSLLEVAGKDGTQGFEDVGHSEDAREMMKKYKIGTLPLDEQSAFIYTCCKPKAKKSSTKIPKDCSDCSASSCPRLPKSPSEKSWRTFDGSPSSRSLPGSVPKKSSEPKAEPHVGAIVVPRESSKWKWILLALATAAVIGVVVKKYAAK